MKTVWKMDSASVDTLRRCSEAKPSSILVYSALREIATSRGSADFETTAGEIAERSLLTEKTVGEQLPLLVKRRLIDRKRLRRGVRVRLLRVVR